MITGWYTSKRERPKWQAPIVLGQPHGYANDDYKYRDVARDLKITVEEARRRDKRIKDAYLSCRLFKGMNVELTDSKLREKKNYVFAQIRGVVKDIFEYGNIEWSENPYIVTVTTDEGEINCTSHYFQPVLGQAGGTC